jgi:hypothetical protein
MTVIRDPDTSRGSNVTTDGAQLVQAITESGLEFISERKGLSFSWASETYDPDAGDTILLVKNTSSTLDLHIDNVWLSCDTDTRVVIHLVTADVTVAGTTITGINLNTGSTAVAEASAARDETGNTQGSVIWSGEIYAAGPPVEVDFRSAVILNTDKSIGVDFVSASTAGDVTIMGRYK